MKYLVYLLIIGLIFTGIYFLLKEVQEFKEWQKQKRQNSYDYHPPYYYNPPKEKEYSFDFSYMPYKKANLLTKTEYAFFIPLLKECHKRKLMVCPKVRLEDIAYVTDMENRQKYRGYIKSRHIDFILVNMHCETIAGVELDDPSHNTEEATIIDTFKNEVFRTIQVPLIRIQVGTDYASQICMAFDELEL